MLYFSQAPEKVIFSNERVNRKKLCVRSKETKGSLLNLKVDLKVMSFPTQSITSPVGVVQKPSRT